MTHNEFVARKYAFRIDMVPVLFGQKFLELGNALGSEFYAQGQAGWRGVCSRHLVFRCCEACSDQQWLSCMDAVPLEVRACGTAGPLS